MTSHIWFFTGRTATQAGAQARSSQGNTTVALATEHSNALQTSANTFRGCLHSHRLRHRQALAVRDISYQATASLMPQAPREGGGCPKGWGMQIQGRFCRLHHSREQQGTSMAPAASRTSVQACPCLLLLANQAPFLPHRHRSTVTVCHTCCCPSAGPQF